METDTLDARGSEVTEWLKRNRYWLLIPAVLLIAYFGWRHVSAIQAFITDPTIVEETVAQLGWFGPIALIIINAIQIVFAPIPGYPVQVAAGYLYGPVWGGIYGSLGMLLGATIAFWLTRIFGRPLAEKLVGHGRLEKWESVSHSTSTVVWFFLLLGPTGDIPYFLAGLSSVGFLRIIVITALLRVPAVFLAAAAGAMALPWWQLIVIYSILAGIAGLFLLYQNRLKGWMEKRSGQSISPIPLQADLNQDKS